MSTRMIERWFPCAEVSEQSAGRGWGSAFAEKSLFTWFASRPLAQAKAAVICSLLPWPDDVDEQNRLKTLVRESMGGYDSANTELRSELSKHYPYGAKMADPFSGRAIIPLEAARLGVQAWGIDYSPVATLAGQLLADYAMRDWDNEPDLPFDGYQAHKITHFADPRLLRDVRFILDTRGRSLHPNDERLLSDRGWPTAVGLRVRGHPTLWQLRQPVPAHREPQAAKPQFQEERSGTVLPHRCGCKTAGTFKTEVHDGRPDGTAHPCESHR